MTIPNTLHLSAVRGAASTFRMVAEATPDPIFRTLLYSLAREAINQCDEHAARYSLTQSYKEITP